jgi:NAD(P)-dependent dehydrogenase (short-subunit alcohol dehydrogenase family)
MEPNIFSVKDKVVIVTGAMRGNGRAIAEGFLEHGAVVYFFDLLEDIESIVELTKSYRAHSIVGDLRNKADIDRLVSTAQEENGCIDVLINNAGVSLSADDCYKEDVWDMTFEVNLKGSFLLSSKVAEVMKEKRTGSIINITSLGAELGFPGNPSYVASKGGLKQLTKAMAVDFAQYDIRVNNVCPGYFKTDMTLKSYNDPDLREARNKRIMLGRWGNPSDLVGPCIFLASEAAAYVTGIDLLVDGGWVAKGL